MTMLASCACDPADSRGRRHPEPDAPTRSAFQRDRDRIVHSTAFRRLVYKTQVFLNHEGDLFRTRLTHSLEVAQLGRSIARTLRLNEDLVEAIALAHDLGHTPFGHAGQDALNACLKTHNPDSAGFEHNLQSLRVVDTLEERYPDYNGLNLSFETREGILKHCSRRNARRIEAREPGGVARRFLAADQGQPAQQPSLEAQLANLADEIAYNAHDIDDGVRSGLLSLEQLAEVPLFDQHCRETQAQYPGLQGRRLLFETIRRMLSAQVYDVMDATRAALAAAAVDSVQAARLSPPLVCFSKDMAARSSSLKRFLLQNLYRHPQVVETTQTAQQVVRELFAAYMADPAEMPQAHADRFDRLESSPPAGAATPAKPERVVADYIAGMTDRFAAREHERLIGRVAFPA
ncbi:MAG: deoxyguanosinetriphosphate triphosphohydrolase [Polaromonas sp.]|uniref:deoxyguanosinetriphosphate triphosphohydrolase n=1 Tax=Polaromonas sp. TaxID=1869339 RepID=UPI0027314854|nr:deoxyguanosinetriphosphate triphosphohydrolase [Polaromonas sp.]MDP1741905.1 deoxyguanosinetriphosphate triphosphohydrolase [Polaromonas sp.]MDP1955002.1 deoxyguanosinetriphosphate triphosphohydrolase [Polaromonas sp.]MDP3357358.1 deoxyguanosinetriphosphate triphosphohydrolase [Polaromonas sp.]MDP3751256.1 deoxyguanosinetriphosphate triphosphohydrolase [Polaromonas sp.]